MAGMTTLPMAAASATDEPEISLWIIVATTVTMASPPRMNPTRLLARFTRRSEMPEVSISPPARIKSGIASSGKLDAPENRFNGTTLSDAATLPEQKDDRRDRQGESDGDVDEGQENDYSEDEPLHAASAPFRLLCPR